MALRSTNPRAATRTTAPSATGCTCKPAYLTVVRHEGRIVRTPVGHDLKRAQKALRELVVQVDKDEYEPPSNMTFNEHADDFLARLRRRDTTRAQYESTLKYARAVIGMKPVRKLTSADVTAMLKEVDDANRRRRRKKPVTDATLAKHLRTLSVCLEDARRKGRISRNPVDRLSASEKPKPRKGEPSYFTDDELVAILADQELRERTPYWYAARLTATTGMRFGELAGLHLADVRLLDGELTLRRQWTAGEEVDTTKGGKPRTVDLVPAARGVLEEWVAARGIEEGLLFEREIGGHLDNAEARDLLRGAMGRAGVPLVGEQGGKARGWHSLRHTFARISLENGALLQWVQAQLGHSAVTLTADLYGRWSRAAAKREAESLRDAFTV
jgi:integrase